MCDRIPGPLNDAVDAETRRLEQLEEKLRSKGPRPPGPRESTEPKDQDHDRGLPPEPRDPLRGRPGGAPRDENGRYISKADPWDFEGPYHVGPLTWIKKSKDLEAES